MHHPTDRIWKKGMSLFNALNTILFTFGHILNYHSDSQRGNPLPPPHGLLFLATRVPLYVPSQRQDSTYHSFWYTSHGALAGTRNSSMGPP